MPMAISVELLSLKGKPVNDQLLEGGGGLQHGDVVAHVRHDLRPHGQAIGRGPAGDAGRGPPRQARVLRVQGGSDAEDAGPRTVLCPT